MNSNTMQQWPEPVIPVQAISETCVNKIPDRYIKPQHERPLLDTKQAINHNDQETLAQAIPIINLAGLSHPGTFQATIKAISAACREWGFFQVVNHGVSPEIVDGIRGVWRGFFGLSMEKKRRYANSPLSYDGYGSRVGVTKGAVLDWGDYFFVSLNPADARMRDDKWPDEPVSCRETTQEYSTEILHLCKTVMAALSVALGLDSDRLQAEFGAEDEVDVRLRVNYYPKCPRPDLTLGLSPHSDPGGLTVLLTDEDVGGLQVKKEGEWVTVTPAPNAFVVNIGDQIQILSNGAFKSVEHRVVVNADHDRLSLALFYSPRGDVPLGPLPPLLSPESPPHYQPMTYNEYRAQIRKNGPRGKTLVESTSLEDA